MSKEILFSPRSLCRVAGAVEWEDVLTWYNDGSTNQSQFMSAMAIMQERWIRGWSFPDFGEAVRNVAAGEFVRELERILSTWKERISQLVGFYQGLWWSVNRGLVGPKARMAWTPDTTYYPEQIAEANLRWFFEDLIVVCTAYREETQWQG